MGLLWLQPWDLDGDGGHCNQSHEVVDVEPAGFNLAFLQHIGHTGMCVLNNTLYNVLEKVVWIHGMPVGQKATVKSGLALYI